MPANNTAFILADLPPGPVKQLQVVSQTEWKAIRHVPAGVANESKQPRTRETTVLLSMLYATLDGCELTGFGTISHFSPDWIQVNISQASGKRLFIQQRLRLEAAFPETTRAVVVPVGSPGDWLIQATHIPADIAQTLPPPVNLRFQVLQLCDCKALATLMALAQTAPFEKTVPAVNNLLHAPPCRSMPVYVQDDMNMIAHDGIGTHIQREDGRKIKNSFFYPLTTMRIVSTSRVESSRPHR